MTSRDDFDRSFAAWLTETAPTSEPETLLGQVLARTARTRRRPAWRIPERWIPMSAITTRAAPMSRLPLRTVALLALLALALVAGAVIVGSRSTRLPAPFGPAANGVLAYSMDGDVYVVDGLDGSPRAIMADSDHDSAPLFSPDGSKIVVLRGEDPASQAMVVANVDGSDPRTIATGIDRISGAEISPTADVIAAVTEADPSVITMIALDGSGSRAIETGLQQVWGPTFRPSDGARLTFEGLDANGEKGIYLVDRDGTGLVRLDLDPGFEADLYYAVNKAHYFAAPAWSPDGRRLAYHTLEPVPGSPAGPGFRIHVAEIAPTGTVTSDRIVEFDAGADDEFAPLWLPNGDGIVFETLEGDVFRMAVAMVLPAPGPARDLGVSATDWSGATISPDGTQVIAFLGQHGQDEPVVKAIGLASGSVTPVDLGGTDLVWQRRAP